MNYQIINDIDELNRFVEWLPELKKNEIFYGCLFARKKYCPELVHSSDKTQLKRFTFKKENLIDKIRQLECAEGSFKLRENVIPNDALVLYVAPNPRCEKKATYALMKDLVDLMQQSSEGYSLHQQALSAIQKVKGSTYVVDFDFDFKDCAGLEKHQLIEGFTRFINLDALSILETRGGMHVMVHPDKVKKQFQKYWHQGFTEYDILDHHGDMLIPCPGTTQGGFVPKFISL